MAAINPVSGGAGHIPPATAPAAGGQQKAADKAGFAQLVRDYVGKVDSDQHEATFAIQDLVSGKTQDVLPVVQAVAKADLSFKLLIGVRNKVIEAYKQTMNMQV